VKAAIQRRAVRVDESLNIREEAEFFGSEEQIFGFRHTPLVKPRGAVVICSGLLADFRKNYRREVLLGRLLARDGWAVQRFHYRGSGHSDGDTHDVTLDQLTDDALYSARRVEGALDVETKVFVGTRLGAWVAARAATHVAGAALSLWDPTIDPNAYLREAFRARLLRDLRENKVSPSATPAALQEELRRTGQVDVLGHTIYWPLFAGLVGRSLDDLLPPGRRCQLVQIGSRDRVRRELATFVASGQRRGLALDLVIAGEEGSWWLSTADGDAAIRDNEADVVQATRSWIDALGSAEAAG
jgi:hypothetical protein